MDFRDLHELLRQELLRRIERGSLTGTALARQAGFRQAHISNFLNRRRSLSLEGLDRVMAAQHLTVEGFCPWSSGAHSPPAMEVVEAVAVVSSSAAMDEAVMRPEQVIETVPVPSARLSGQRTRASPTHAGWQRFVAIRADAQQAGAMQPMICAGALVVLDRHYTSLAPYRAQERTVYAVRAGASLLLRFVEFDDGRLILRPLSLDFPVQLLGLGAHESPADYLVGRVCLVVAEL